MIKQTFTEDDFLKEEEMLKDKIANIISDGHTIISAGDLADQILALITTQEFLRERLADLEHTRWSGWQAYLHSKCIKNSDGSLTIPVGYVFHLEKQIKTSYKDLTEKEKDSDRQEVNKTLALIYALVKN